MNLSKGLLLNSAIILSSGCSSLVFPPPLTHNQLVEACQKIDLQNPAFHPSASSRKPSSPPTNDSAQDMQELMAAAQQGDPQAQLAMGKRYLKGNGVEADSHSAARWFELAAEQGLGEAQYYYANRLQKGDGVEQNPILAQGFYQAAAEQGVAAAQVELARSLEQQSPPETAQARHWYEQAARQGHPVARINLGLMLARSNLAADRAQALYWWQQAAEQSADGMNYLGYAHEFGVGTDRDSVEALRWYQKAADAGSHLGMRSLGVLYMSGKAGASNPQRAVRELTRAAQSGNAEANYLLAGYYLQQGDEDTAINWLQQGARSGHGPSQYLLSRAYERRGETKQANYWLASAAQLGEPRAKKRLSDSSSTAVATASSVKPPAVTRAQQSAQSRPAPAPVKSTARVSESGELSPEDNAALFEQQGFSALLADDFETALHYFREAENSKNGYHSVYEIQRLLRQNRDQFDDARRRYQLLSEITTEHNWGMSRTTREQFKQRVLEWGESLEQL